MCIYWLTGIPRDRYNLADKIGKLEKKGVKLEKLTITAWESAGSCSPEESSLNKNTPLYRAYLEFEAHFSDGTHYNITDYDSCKIENGKVLKGVFSLYEPEKGCPVSPERYARQYVRNEAVEEARKFKNKGVKNIELKIDPPEEI